MANLRTSILLVPTLLFAACSLGVEFDRSKIDGATDAGRDAPAADTDARDAPVDTAPDASDATDLCANIDCSDLDDDCNVGQCNAATGTCDAVPRSVGTTCSDDLWCTVNDRCDATGNCVGAPKDCNDGRTCTNDVCIEGAEPDLGSCGIEIVADTCLIGGDEGGVCYVDGTSNPDNQCELCASETDPDGWTAKLLGTACDDGLFCTDSEACDGAGTCGGEGFRADHDCSDSSTCTNDMCNETTNDCDHETPPASDQCHIGGQCVAGTVRNPANDCEVCDPNISTTAWTARGLGQGCDDGLHCTVGETCNGSPVCGGGTPYSCVDGVTCTSDTCSEGATRCPHTISTGWCLISTICYSDGVENATACQRCDAGASQIAWTPKSAGTPCEDGLFCTDGDECNGSGACLSVGPNLCSDGLTCTQDNCNESLNDCSHPMVAGTCLIGGAECYDNNDRNPAADCELCTSATAPFAWTDVANGLACTDGLYCTDGDTCDGAGNCDPGAVRTCDDSLPCTDNTCQEGVGTYTCSHPVTTGWGCLISAACYATGTTNSGNQCQWCDPLTSTNAWTDKPATEVCDDELFCTSADKCDGSGACTGTPVDCSDAFICTTDTCQEGVETYSCGNSVTTGCLISGFCRDEGFNNLANQCQACVSATSTTAWTNKAAATDCDDTLFCTKNDACNGAGVCTGVDKCDDGLICTEDSCDEGADSCDNTLMAGYCKIAGLCRTNDELNSSNHCMACRTSLSTTSWRPVVVDTSCDDTLSDFCTTGETCDALGVCQGGSARTCNDSIACTDNACNETTNACEYPIQANQCLIGGLCYANTTPNILGNECEWCSVTNGNTVWTPHVGASCNSSAGTCNASAVCIPN